ncbi:hypothetical protein [Streptomyces sp. NPDC002619]|uniref:hypothetical protein n=1 Tax=Streptomyces sp. NPDC002619 TaxID=3364655 RepID=UPI0036C53004
MSSREACRIVGIDVRSGKKWRNGSHAHLGRKKAAPPIYQEVPLLLIPAATCVKPIAST